MSLPHLAMPFCLCDVMNDMVLVSVQAAVNASEDQGRQVGAGPEVGEVSCLQGLQ